MYVESHFGFPEEFQLCILFDFATFVTLMLTCCLFPIQVSLEGFRNKRFNCLVATNVAGRGIDIPVINPEPLLFSFFICSCYFEPHVNRLDVAPILFSGTTLNEKPCLLTLIFFSLGIQTWMLISFLELIPIVTYASNSSTV